MGAIKRWPFDDGERKASVVDDSVDKGIFVVVLEAVRASVWNWSLLMHCSTGVDVIVIVVASCLRAIALLSTCCCMTSRVLPPPITLRSAWRQRHRNRPAEDPQFNSLRSRYKTTAPQKPNKNQIPHILTYGLKVYALSKRVLHCLLMLQLIVF